MSPQQLGKVGAQGARRDSCFLRDGRQYRPIDLSLAGFPSGPGHRLDADDLGGLRLRQAVVFSEILEAVEF